MRVHKRGALVIASALTAAALAACSSGTTTPSASDVASSDPAGDITISGVYGGTSDPFWTTMVCGAQAKADSLGVEFHAHTSTNLEVSSFAQNFQTAQLDNPSGVIVNPSNANQFLSEYQSLMSEGTPVVTIAGTTPAAQVKVVGTDSDSSEFIDAAVDLIPEGSGTMAVLGGIQGLAPVESRYFPFLEAVKDARPDLEPLPTEYTFFDVNKATSYVSSVILAHPDLQLIVAASGPEGQGAAAALQQSGKAGEIALIALDATPPEVDALKAGVISALLAQSPSRIGAAQVETLVDYITGAEAGEPVEASSEEVSIPQRLLTADNVDDPDNADWIYKASC